MGWGGPGPTLTSKGNDQLQFLSTFEELRQKPPPRSLSLSQVWIHTHSHTEPHFLSYHLALKLDPQMDNGAAFGHGGRGVPLETQPRRHLTTISVQPAAPAPTPNFLDSGCLKNVKNIVTRAGQRKQRTSWLHGKPQKSF